MNDIESQIRTKIIPLLILFILWITPSIMNYLKYQKEVAELQKKEIHGKLIGIGDLNRGDFEVKIKTAKKIFITTTLELGDNIQNGNVQLGDSVSKGANMDFIYFYRLKKGKYFEVYRYYLY